MKLIITIGDCNGVGIEVMLKAISSYDTNFPNSSKIEFSISGNIPIIEEYVSMLHSAHLPKFKFEDDGIEIGNRFCKILECKTNSKVEFGKLSTQAGKLAAESIEIALEGTLNGQYDALVTMPVSKHALYNAGWELPGHTEMLAKRCNVLNPLMILCTKNIRVALVTIHTPLYKVQEQITTSRVIERISVLNKSLQSDFGITKPEIAVLGLNPHAGEDGSLGSEEIDFIIPAIERCKKAGMKVLGPYPADGFFAHGAYNYYDGILAMYHDQGLIPLKLLAEGTGVNFTAGLPIVRTSPDHGTAFALAGKGKADERSALNAIILAKDIAEMRKE